MGLEGTDGSSRGLDMMTVSVLQQHHWTEFGGVNPGTGVCAFVFLQRAWLTLDIDQHLTKTFESSDSLVTHVNTRWDSDLSWRC